MAQTVVERATRVFKSLSYRPPRDLPAAEQQDPSLMKVTSSYEELSRDIWCPADVLSAFSAVWLIYIYVQVFCSVYVAYRIEYLQLNESFDCVVYDGTRLGSRLMLRVDDI